MTKRLGAWLYQNNCCENDDILTLEITDVLIEISFTLFENEISTKLRYVKIYFIAILLHTCEDEVAEWLRRWTANPLWSPRVGSNPILVELYFLLK